MFAVDRYTQPGPRGGKPRGYCLEWRGPCEAPLGRARRSGWYLHRRDAETAARGANEAVQNLADRPTRPPQVTGDGAHFVRLVDPAGAVFWWSYYGATPDGERATRYRSRAAAVNGVAQALGNGPAFWEAERRSRENQRRRMRGWTALAIDESDLKGGA